MDGRARCAGTAQCSHAEAGRSGPRGSGRWRRGLPVVTAVLALAALAGDVVAQRPAAVASPTRPRPLTTRPMGLPASVQPSGRSFPARPLPYRRPGAARDDVVPGYPYPHGVVYPPLVYPPVGHPPRPYRPWAYPPFAFMPYAPYAWYPAPMTVVEPVAVATRVRVTTFATPAPSGCAVVEIDVSGERWRNLVPLPLLGATTPEALRAAIAARLAAGGQVTLQTLNGTRFMIPGGYDAAELVVEPCGDEAPASDDPGGS